MILRPLRLNGATIVRAVAAGVAMARIARGAHREPPLTALEPSGDVGAGQGTGAGGGGSMSVVIAARDEQDRLGGCLTALAADPLATDVVVVDDQSTDGTAALARDHGVRVIAPGPRPPGWTGKPWALQQGIEAVDRQWVVTLDADTRIVPGLLGALLSAAHRCQADLLTVGARFDCPSPGERLVHPAMLATLVYRFGPPGTRRPPRPGRALANGQCMVLPRRSFLGGGGFGPVSGSLVEDVALARHIARRGGTVRFLDGTDLLQVVGYGSAGAAWRGWGRSLALAEVTAPMSLVCDIVLLWNVMATPLPRLLLGRGDVLDAGLVALRIGVLVAVAGAYRQRGLTWWLSPSVDLAVVANLVTTAVRPIRTWRGRTYQPVRVRSGGGRPTRPSRTATR